MKNITTLIALFVSYICGAQNYECLQSGVKHYFTNGDGYLRGIRIDSVNTFADSVVYYPFHTPRGDYQKLALLDTTGGSWLGNRVVALNDGTFIFDNILHDSLIIKAHAHAGDSWIFYTDTAAVYYGAQVVSEDTMTILGAIDSVKRISLVAYNSSGPLPADPLNNFTIVLSKSHGFVQVFDLYTFPYRNDIHDYFLDMVNRTSGVITKANAHFSLMELVDPTYEQLYDWHVGDVYEFAVCDGSLIHPMYSNFIEHYDLDTITSVVKSPGKTTYSFSRLYSGIDVASGHYSPLQDKGTVAFTTDFLVDTVFMPEEFHQKMIYHYHPVDTSFCSVGPLFTLQRSDITNDKYARSIEGSPQPFDYKTPFGLLYHREVWDDPMFVVTSRQLLYYDRAGSVCRGVVAPVAVMPLEKEHTVFISPNPVADQLNILSSDKIGNILITDPAGRMIFTHTSGEQELRLNVSSFSAGVYLIKIGAEVRRFIKQ